MNIPLSRPAAGWLAAIAAASSLFPTARGQEAAPYQRDARGPVDLHTQKTLYVVPYAHLDTQWRWAYPQVIREFIANTLHQQLHPDRQVPQLRLQLLAARAATR